MRSASSGGRRAGLLVACSVVALVACHANIRFDDLTICTQDVDCILPALHCDSGTCVACTSDAHCTAPGFTRCDPARNRCVECNLTSDCTGGAVCKSNHCATSCTASSGCPTAAPRCDDGACVQCDDNGAACSGSTVGPFCVAHTCSACAADQDCGATFPRCDAVVHRCVQCQLNSDCPATKPLCDIAAGTCVAVP